MPAGSRRTGRQTAAVIKACPLKQGVALLSLCCQHCSIILPGWTQSIDNCADAVAHANKTPGRIGQARKRIKRIFTLSPNREREKRVEHANKVGRAALARHFAFCATKFLRYQHAARLMSVAGA
jgi:hypothetical protein